MMETQAHWYSSESTQRELSNEYQHDRAWMVFKMFCFLVLWAKIASAFPGLEGLSYDAHAEAIAFHSTSLTTHKLNCVSKAAA